MEHELRYSARCVSFNSTTLVSREDERMQILVVKWNKKKKERKKENKHP